MFGASKTPFGGGGFGTPFGGTSGGLFGSKTPAANTFGTPSFGTPASSSGLFGTTSTGTNLFGAKTTASTGFGFGTASTGGLFGGGTSVFQAPQTASSFGFGQVQTGTTVKFVPPTSSEQAQKSGQSLTIKIQNQCITMMDQYKTKCVEELRLEDYEAGRKTGTATGGFGSTGTGLFGSQTTTSGGLFGSSTSTSGFGGFGKTAATSGGLFGSSSGSLFGAKTTASLFGTTTTTTSAFGFGTGGGGLFGKPASSGTGLFGTTTTTSSLFGGGFGTTASTGTSLFGSTPAFGQPASQSTSIFGQTAKPAFGFGTSTGGFGSTSTGGLFGGTSSSGGLFGSTANKPTFSFGGTSTGFGTGTTGGFGGFGTTATSSGGLFGGTSTGTSLFGTKPTGFGTTGFGATSTSGSLFGGTGFGLGGGGFGATQNTGLSFGGSTLGGISNVDQGTLAALQQQQLIQQQIKALANTPFGDSPLFRNLTETSKPKSTQSTTSVTAKEPINISQYKVLSRPAARVKPRPISSPSIGKSHLFEGLEEEGDFSPHPLVPRKSVKKLVLKNKSHSETGSPFEEGHLKLRMSSSADDDLVAPSPEVVKTNAAEPTSESPVHETTKSHPFIDTISELDHEESTPVATKTTNYVITPLPISEVENSLVEGNSEVMESAENEEELPKCKIVLTRSEYYTKPPVSELDERVNEEQCQCLIQGFTVGREGYGEVKFLGVTDIYGLNLDEIISFRRKEVEVYADNYESKPEVGKELNKPAEITLLKVWPNDKSLHTPVKSPERLKASGFIDKIEEKTAALDAVFIDYRPKEGAWVFKVNHFTRYGMQEEFIDDGLDIEARKRIAKGSFNVEPVSKLAEDIDFAKEELKRKVQMKMDTLDISHNVEDSEMEDSAEVEESVPIQEDDYSETEEFLSSSHQQSKVADVKPFNLQGMKSSILYEDEDEDMAATKVKKKKMQLFSNKTIFSSSFAEPAKSQSPFPKLDLSSTAQVQDTLNSTVFQNILPSQDESTSQCQPSGSTKFQKKSHLFQSGVFDTTSLVQDAREDTRRSVQPGGDESLFIKCQTYKMLPYEQSLLYGKTSLLADAALSHSREFNVRWCNNMNLVHSGIPLGSGSSLSKKVAASVFTGNFVSPSSTFGLGNSVANVEKIEKNTSTDLKTFLEDCLEISLKNTLFEAGTKTSLELLKLKDGVEALANYTEKATSYTLATASHDIGEFQMQSSVWNLVAALWGKLDEDIETPYEIHAVRRDAFSKWLSTVVDEDVQGEIASKNMKDEGHLSVILSLLSANKIREACKVARENKELRLAFLLSQVCGDYHLKNYMRSQLCLWEERNIDLYMNNERLKIYILLSGMMVWKSIKSSTLVNLCEKVDWKRALALHLWYHCTRTATINDAFIEYRKAYRGTEMYKSYAPYPSPRYNYKLSTSDEVDKKTKDICYHIISLYCKREHSLEKLLTPKTYTAAPLDYHLSWHLHEVLFALGYEHLSEEKHNLLQHSYAAELELVGLWHWAVFVLMHLRDDSRRERCVKEILNRYCRVSDDEDNVLKLTTEESTIVDKFHVPVQWVHEAKALHAKFIGRHYDEALHLMRAGQWNNAHIVVTQHLSCDAIIEEAYGTLKGVLSDMSLPERCCTIKNWRIGGQVFLDYILLKEKLDDMKTDTTAISSYHLEDMEGEVASLINRISVMKVENARERLCQSEMARNCSSMQKFVLSYTNSKDNDDDNDDTPRWSSIKVAPYIVNLPLPPDYYLKELRELLGNYACEIEQSERTT